MRKPEQLKNATITRKRKHTTHFPHVNLYIAHFGPSKFRQNRTVFFLISIIGCQFVCLCVLWSILGRPIVVFDDGGGVHVPCALLWLLVMAVRRRPHRANLRPRVAQVESLRHAGVIRAGTDAVRSRLEALPIP